MFLFFLQLPHILHYMSDSCYGWKLLQIVALLFIYAGLVYNT